MFLKDNPISAEMKSKHILYCILDQIEELNYKLFLEIILDINITDLWMLKTILNLIYMNF